MTLNVAKKKVLKNLNLTKKYSFLQKVSKNALELKKLLASDQKYRNLNSLLKKKNSIKNKKIFLLSYIICFSFSPKNTLLHITDVWGNLKFRYSAGLVGVTGKQKKNRILVLGRMCNVLKKIRITLLKNKPIALHLNNVGSYKYFIIKRLKKEFFIQVIKNYETYAYNGCRSKKRLHKRQRSKKR